MAVTEPTVNRPKLEISELDVQRRTRIVGLQQEDLSRIAAIRPIVAERAEALANVFFDYLKPLPEAAALFGRADLLADARRRKQEHLLAMVSGDYGRQYAEQRIDLGYLYGRVGLDVPVFLGAFHTLLMSIGLEIMRRGGRDAEDGFRNFMSLKKVAFFDIGLIIDVIIAERERVIRQQQEAIRELSTPVLQVRDRLLILPIIGVIDSQRAKQLTDGLLHAIRANRARVVVMDITGVAAVDSKVANHFIQTVAAAKLMGATVIITGLTAEVAQALVALGVDLGRINTVGDLQGGLEEAERLLGLSVVEVNARDARSAAD